MRSYRAVLLIDVPSWPCYDARDMKESQTVRVSFYFYFYFGADTQPHLLRAGTFAMAGEA